MRRWVTPERPENDASWPTKSCGSSADPQSDPGRSSKRPQRAKSCETVVGGDGRTVGRARFTPDSRRKLQSHLVATGQLPAQSWASFEDCTMPTTVNHNINIDDTVSNWLKWGNLVLAWAKGHQ